MLSNRERWKIVLLFAWLGPLVGGLTLGLPIALLVSDPGISGISGMLGVLFFSYPVGIIPAVMAGFLTQWAYTWATQNAFPLNQTTGFLTGAASGLLSALALMTFVFDFHFVNWSTGRDWGPLLLFTVPGTVAGGACAVVALRRMWRNNPDVMSAKPQGSSI